MRKPYVSSHPAGTQRRLNTESALIQRLVVEPMPIQRRIIIVRPMGKTTPYNKHIEKKKGS